MMAHVSFPLMLPAHCKSVMYSFSCRCKVRISCFWMLLNNFDLICYNFLSYSHFFSPSFAMTNTVVQKSAYGNVRVQSSMKSVITRNSFGQESESVCVHVLK